MLGLVAVLVLVGSACTLSPVDLRGKACPCAEGWRCDETSTCVPANADSGPRADGAFDAGSDDGGLSDADGGATGDGDVGVDGGSIDAGPPAGYARTLTVSRTSVTGMHADFPLLVAIASDASLAAHARDDASDLRFHASDGALLPHEIESWDGATGALVAWVRVPLLTDARDTVLSLRYGHADPPAALAPTTVWSSGFAAVWHLSAAPATATGEAFDSTGRGHLGTSSAASRPALAAGRIADGFAFDAASMQRLSVADSPDWDFTARPVTISAWVRADSVQPGGDYPRLLDRFRGGTPGAGWVVMMTPSRNVVLNHRHDGTGDVIDVGAASAIDDATWHFLTVTLDGSVARFYLDGAVRESDPYAALLDNAEALDVGASGNTGLNAFAGILDEIRIAHVARSPEYVATEHRNQSDPSAFVVVGPEERL